jgi:L-2-hydroxyglutarate oxidase
VTYDYLIVGGGVTGVALSRALATRASKAKIAVIEKHSGLATQASGRNSGVVHVGYNQKPGTLKAKLVVEGGRQLKAYCREKKVPLRERGLLVVGRQGQESTLETLLARGRENGVEGLQILTPREFAEHEPNAAGSAGLWAPCGATVDSLSFVKALAAEASEHGVEVRLGSALWSVERKNGGFEVRTPSGTLSAKRLINCAGAQADRIAHMLGAGLDYTMVPFRGEYYVYAGQDLVRGAVYAAPDLEFPFLGIHWTAMPDGSLHVGPNAALAFGRESYSFKDIDREDLREMFGRGGFWKMLWQRPFLKMARLNFRTSLSQKAFQEEALRLVRAGRPAGFSKGHAGIRAQLVDRNGTMVDDLVTEEKDGALHLLNVVSPGLTCSLPFADHLADMLLR